MVLFCHTRTAESVCRSSLINSRLRISTVTNQHETGLEHFFSFRSLSPGWSSHSSDVNQKCFIFRLVAANFNTVQPGIWFFFFVVVQFLFKVGYFILFLNMFFFARGRWGCRSFFALFLLADGIFQQRRIESNIYQHTHTVLTHSYGKEKVIEPGQGLLAFGPKTKSKPEKLTKQKSFYREFFFPFYYSSNWTNQFHIRFNDPVEMKLTLFNYLLHHFSKW